MALGANFPQKRIWSFIMVSSRANASQQLRLCLWYSPIFKTQWLLSLIRPRAQIEERLRALNTRTHWGQWDSQILNESRITSFPLMRFETMDFPECGECEHGLEEHCVEQCRGQDENGDPCKEFNYVCHNEDCNQICRECEFHSSEQWRTTSKARSRFQSSWFQFWFDDLCLSCQSHKAR